MIANTHSAIPFGYEGRLVEVEGDITRGLPTFNIVGLGSKTISEARDRVRSALSSSGFSFPDKHLTINLAPADLNKDGPHLDLPLALTVLVLSGQILQQDLDHRLFVGELSLNGDLKPVRGVINVVEAARTAGMSEVYVPRANLAQARLVPGIKVFGPKNLTDLFLHLKGQKALQLSTDDVVKNTITEENPTYLDHILGQDLAKRALTIAIAGHHNLLISGPPGAGKTLLARAALSLLPPPSPEEIISITKIHSLSEPTDHIITTRPFRAPHHTASKTSIIGGGTSATPGEISLAHLGVLFLDEVPEYPRSILEALRQPLEDKRITICRANLRSSYPADFMLIATMNPCPCGYFGDPTHECTCTTTQVENYRKKLSGPLFDRIDLYLTVSKVKNSDLIKHSSVGRPEHDVVKNTITEATALERARYHRSDFYNSSLSSHQISTLLHLEKSAEQLLHSASDRLGLSARAYFKVIKVAQTIADLEKSPVIKDSHIAEALSYRRT